MNNKQVFLEITDHFADLMVKIEEIYYSDRFDPDDFGGYMEGFTRTLEQAEDEWYDKHR